MRPFEKVFCVVACGVVLCGLIAGYWIDQKVDAAAGTADRVADHVAARDRIVDLPEDGKEYHLVLLLHNEWRKLPRERRVATMFETNAALVSLKSQCHYHVYTPADPEFKMFEDYVKQLPCILLETSEGAVKTKLSGDNITDDEDELAAAFNLEMKVGRRHPLRPWVDRPNPDPKPCPDCKPRPKPDPKPDRLPIPDTPLPKKPEFPWGILALCVVVTGIATGVVAFRRRVN